MKIEDMSRDQLVALIKQQSVELNNLTLSVDQAWSRWENSNKLCNSYIKEFEDRGLTYIPNNHDLH